ncbi:hypothetical protein [Methanolobus psychrotolerans]|uniref:hypothetical protein n=1 Tax=Methanolobus psychrotolerans TaxID=1874706 RepID=UPI00101AE981|nr:hypothetical protein [Methanolobus psychrotolerans]
MGIKIYDEPRKGSVKRVQNLKNQWYIRNLPLEKLDPKMTVSGAIQECLSKDPELLFKFTEFQQDVEDFQLIMLATVLTYDETKALEDQMTVKEFEELVKTCKTAIGGGVDTFFGESASDMSSTTETTPENLDYMSSSGQPGGLSEESTGH